MPGLDPPAGDAEPDPDEYDDDAPSGAPPDPLDRLWFHPSELGAITSRPADAPDQNVRRHSWGLVAIAAITGAMTAVGVVAAAGLLNGSGTDPTASLARAAGQSGDSTAVSNALVQVSPAVVAVHAVGADPHTPPVDATGVAVTDRDVLTSLDVVTGAATVTVTSRGRVLAASVTGVDVATGLALLRIPGGQLTPAPLGSSDGLDIGQMVVGIGTTAGDHRWIDEGIVTALGRLATNDQGTAMTDLIETSLRPTAGTTGSALVTSSGDVVGIFVGPLPGSAMPMDWARDIVTQLKESGKVHHAWLGAAVSDATDVSGGGARIVTTTPLGPAASAGLAPGDVITAVGDDPVSTAAELLAAVMQRRPGDPVTVKFRRLGSQLRKQVTLAERLATPVTDANGAVTG